MPLFRKISKPVEAQVWNEHGDHPAVISYCGTERCDYWKCKFCGKSLDQHGWIETLPGRIVCPGDWIIYENHRYSTCKPNLFEKKYEMIHQDTMISY